MRNLLNNGVFLCCCFMSFIGTHLWGQSSLEECKLAYKKEVNRFQGTLESDLSWIQLGDEIDSLNRRSNLLLNKVIALKPASADSNYVDWRKLRLQLVDLKQLTEFYGKSNCPKRVQSLFDQMKGEREAIYDKEGLIIEKAVVGKVAFYYVYGTIKKSYDLKVILSTGEMGNLTYRAGLNEELGFISFWPSEQEITVSQVERVEERSLPFSMRECF